MKLALICPSNLLYMPYVNNYINILDSLNIEYKVINWDRLSVAEEINGYTFKDKKKQHQRNYYDYFKYKRFIIEKLENEKFDKIIVFTLQLGYFIKKYLVNNFSGDYIFDIRDYNKIFRFSDFAELIRLSYSCVISSPGYKEWLPQSDKYLVNHNTTITSLNELDCYNVKKYNEAVNILTIGVLRHWNVNIDFVNQLKNSNKYNLIFHGEGNINDKLKSYVENNNINNIQLYGRYKKEEEGDIYKSIDLVNTLLYADNINCRTLLSNRLYNAVLYGKPMLSLDGTYQAEIIRDYGVGLVVKSLDNLKDQITDYLKTFSYEQYNRGRVEFITSVIKENKQFERIVKNFISS